MNEYNVIDLMNVMMMKNNLINAGEKLLIDNYKGEEDYAFFIDTVNVLIDTELSFLLLDSRYIKKIEAVIYKYRFDYKDKDYLAVVNEIITKFNEVNGYSDSLKEAMTDSYLKNQCELRKYDFSDMEEFNLSLMYDAICLMAMKENQEQLITNETLFYCSSNYFINVIPEIYEDDRVCEMTDRIINRRLNKFDLFGGNLKKFAKETTDSIQKIKRRE